MISLKIFIIPCSPRSYCIFWWFRCIGCFSSHFYLIFTYMYCFFVVLLTTFPFHSELFFSSWKIFIYPVASNSSIVFPREVYELSKAFLLDTYYVVYFYCAFVCLRTLLFHSKHFLLKYIDMSSLFKQFHIIRRCMNFQKDFFSCIFSFLLARHGDATPWKTMLLLVMGLWSLHLLVQACLFF